MVRSESGRPVWASGWYHVYLPDGSETIGQVSHFRRRDRGGGVVVEEVCVALVDAGGTLNRDRYLAGRLEWVGQECTRADLDALKLVVEDELETDVDALVSLVVLP